jgi:hypothetical protein
MAEAAGKLCVVGGAEAPSFARSRSIPLRGSGKPAADGIIFESAPTSESRGEPLAARVRPDANYPQPPPSCRRPCAPFTRSPSTTNTAISPISTPRSAIRSR